MLDLIDYGVKNNRGYRYNLVVINNFSNYGWTSSLKDKYASTINDAFAEILTETKRKLKMMETDDEKEFANKMFESYLKSQNIKSILDIIERRSFCRKIQQNYKKSFEEADI